MMEFEYNGDGVCGPGQIDKVLELIDVCLYVPFALEVSV
jgi:hypothetical protein